MTRMNKLMSGAALVVLGTASLALAATDSQPGAAQAERPAPMTRMFERFDTDGDGNISREEFAAHGPAAGFAEAFAVADADGNGALEGDELIAFADARRAAREAARLEMRKQRMQSRMLERFDADGDGTLSLEELQAQGPMGFFDRFDADEDGSVSADELAQAAPMRHGQRGDAPRGEDGHMMRHDGRHDADHGGKYQGGKFRGEHGHDGRKGKGAGRSGMQDFWQY